jgi:serine/threonine protein kinase
MSSGLLGTLLSGRYRLDARIGSGGMSTVYRAFDTTLEREVAIKLMNREIAAKPDQLERFRREARAVAQHSHPHIVGIIDAGEDNGRPYIVFEYVEGETLKQRIRRLGRLPIGEAVAYAIEIARALEAAHDRNIVHRDVKPQNVLIDEEGSAKVTDFGIARSLDDEEEALTADGRVLGTTDYVSPEQALGHPVTGQSDLYSLGIVLFEMLTGDVPYRGENQVAVAMKHVREPLPDVQVRRPEVSAALAAVVDRATDKELDRRYPDAAAMIADLEDALAIEAARSGQTTGEATTVLRSLPKRTKRRVPLRLRSPGLYVALAVLAAIAVALVVLLGSQSAHRGTGTHRIKPAVAGLKEVSLAQNAAHDYDPEGDDHEHTADVNNVLDGNRGTSWTTESYQGDTLNKGGVGLYVDAHPKALGRELDLQTRTPGFTASIYGASSPVPPNIRGWTKLAGPTVTKSKTQFKFPTNQKAFRYYLVWITKLPPGKQQASISELTLSIPR